MTGRNRHSKDESKAKMVRLSLESGRTIDQVAKKGLEVRKSTLTAWRRQLRDTEPLEPLDDPKQEIARLKRENECLRQERDLSKKQRTSSRRKQGDDVQIHRIEEGRGPSLKNLPIVRRVAKRLRCVARSSGEPATTSGHGPARAARNAFALSNETYGSPRMTADLKEEGVAVGRRRVARPMRQTGLQARRKRCYKHTTDSHHACWLVTPNLLDRDVAADAPDRKWAVDTSYVWTAEGWLCLAIVMDLYSRRIIGWLTSDRLKRDLALEALRQAVALKRPPAGLIHHSDRGSQYCSIDYRTELRGIGAIASMSGKGSCCDSAVVETFFKTIKSELVWRASFASRVEATREIAQYIDGFYNPVRRHSALGYQAPIVARIAKWLSLIGSKSNAATIFSTEHLFFFAAFSFSDFLRKN